MTFYFGEDSDRAHIEARNLDQAIRVYKVKELFPEEHVWRKHIKSHDRDDDDNKVYTYKVSLILNELLEKFGKGVYKIVQKHCPNLTCCRDCHIDDFCHVESCAIVARARAEAKKK